MVREGLTLERKEDKHIEFGKGVDSDENFIS
jgi:hypothetical protein